MPTSCGIQMLQEGSPDLHFAKKKNEMNIEIETRRLLLVPVTQKYTADIFKNFTLEVTAYMFPCPAKNNSETENIVESWMKQRADKTDFVYAITRKDTSEFLGMVGLHGLNNDTPELGIWTKISSHGNHYGREAVGGLIQYAQKQGYTKLIYPVDKKNVASKKIPLFYGGKLIVTSKLVTTPDGRTLDEEIYEIAL